MLTDRKILEERPRKPETDAYKAFQGDIDACRQLFPRNWTIESVLAAERAGLISEWESCFLTIDLARPESGMRAGRY